MKILSDMELMEICKRYHIELDGIYSRDELPTHLPSGSYIFKLDRASGGGTHWVQISVTPSGNLYRDSFGFEPFQELVERLNNAKVIHSETTSSCGWWCCYCLWYMQNHGNNEKTFKDIKEVGI